jgi:hypothetical protein
VLEFKTGRPAPEHGGQVALYASVAARLFPGATVTPKLIYTGSRGFSSHNDGRD